MTWTYTSPTTSTKDAIRLLIGDTNALDPLLSDEEITYLISVYGSALGTASEAARTIAARFAREMDRSIGSLSASFSQKYQHYLELSEKLDLQAQSQPVAPYFSGWKPSQRLLQEQNTDRDELVSKIGGMDNHEGSSSGYS